MSGKYKIRSQDLPYFITFATESWVDVFTRPVYKQIIIDSLKFCQENKGLIVYAWCLMTNHIHMVVGRNGESGLDEIIRDFKKFTSVRICRAIESSGKESRRWMLSIFRDGANESRKHVKYRFWQNEYHPIELFSNKFIDQKINYIHENPVKAEIVEKAEDYLYSSARDYAGHKGLIEIRFAD